MNELFRTTKLSWLRTTRSQESATPYSNKKYSRTLAGVSHILVSNIYILLTHLPCEQPQL